MSTGQRSVSSSEVGTSSTRSLALAAPPAGWANTGTQVLSLKSAADRGALPSTQSLTVRLGLQLHNIAQLQQVIKNHQKLTPSAIKSSFGPTASEVAKVTSYLQSMGLGSVKVANNNLLISATGSAAQVSKAFNTSLHAYSVNGVSAYANTAPAYVPSALNGIVIAVLGLNNVQAFKVSPHVGTTKINHAAVTASAPAPQPESPCAVSSVYIVGLPSPQPIPTPQAYTTGCPRNYTPSDYWRAYDINTTPPASNVNIAIMAEGDVTQAIADLRTNEQGDGLPQVPVVVKQVGLASTDTSGDDEWTLDMTASSGIAGNVNTIYVYDTTSLTDSDISNEFNQFVSDDLAPVANASFGGCEALSYVDGSMVLNDEILVEGAAQGQTLFASTGDTGSFCSVGNPNGVPGGVPLVEYPAASPYVMAVGGTTLWSQYDGSYQGESAWVAGGGGISQFEYSPYWESPAQTVGTTPAGASFRGVPDIAMDGDLQTGMILYITGDGWTVIGGTSLSSPLAAGTWARMLQSHPGLPFGPIAYYSVFGASNPGTKLLGPPPTINVGPFHDVVSGGNGAYVATPNYDYTSGLGSIDVDAMNAALGQ
ncbi:MAG TPA: S53 family peptidase [Candidatus Elarobacter sp.]|nr:S53 family peptidase [Candidatus Elarobacter sp.]